MTYYAQTPADTFRLGERFAARLQGGEVVSLEGDLGMGKTLFTKGLAAGLGITETVTSPTFTVMNDYAGRLNLYHYDAYRLASLEEAEEAGLTECLADPRGVTVVEWAENLGTAFVPRITTVVRFACKDGGRELTFDDKQNTSKT